MTRLMTLILACSVSCVSMEDKDLPPELTHKSTIKELLNGSLDFGGKVLKQTKKIVTETNRWPQMATELRLYLKQNLRLENKANILRAAHLYQASVPALEPEVLRLFTRHHSSEIAVIGWQLAAIRPSSAVKRFIEEEVSYFVIRNWESKLLIPTFAMAVQENEVKSVYSLLQLGLDQSGNDEFAKAMVFLDPERSSAPFMDYLGKATIEDLRQINQSSINVYTCLVILRHFAFNPIPLGHPNVSHLFMYAVSRNTGLSEMARDVIESQLPEFKEQMVHALASLPMEVQISFVEGTRRQPSSNFRILMSQLKLSTRYHQVVEEIDAIKTF